MHVDLVDPISELSATDRADAAHLLSRLVAAGAALGWVDPPTLTEVTALLHSLAAPSGSGKAASLPDEPPAPGSLDGQSCSSGREDAWPAGDAAAVGGRDAVEAALAVARDEGRLVGLAYWRRYDRPTHRPHADVEKVAVDPSHQGRGIGRELLTALVAAARAARVEVLTLDLRADNTRAAALYESLGFVQYGRLPRFVAVGDQRWDKLFYALDLR